MTDAPTKLFAAIEPKCGDEVVAGPDLNQRFYGRVRAWFPNAEGDWFVVIEIKHASAVFHICPLASVRRITHDPRNGETRIEQYTVLQ